MGVPHTSFLDIKEVRYSVPSSNNDAKYTNMKYRDYDGSWLNWSVRPYWTPSVPEIYY